MTFTKDTPTCPAGDFAVTFSPYTPGTSWNMKGGGREREGEREGRGREGGGRNPFILIHYVFSEYTNRICDRKCCSVHVDHYVENRVLWVQM